MDQTNGNDPYSNVRPNTHGTSFRIISNGDANKKSDHGVIRVSFFFLLLLVDIALVAIVRVLESNSFERIIITITTTVILLRYQCSDIPVRTNLLSQKEQN